VSGTPDVLIVGGGVIGCAIGYYLTRAEARVTIVERRRIAQEASWASAGLLSPPKKTPLGLEHAQLEARSFRMYPTLLAELQEETGLGVEYVRSGRLSVAFDEVEEAALRELLAWQQALGFALTWRDGDEARREEPALGPAIRGGVWCADAGNLRAARLTLALARAARQRGATILEETAVEAFIEEGEGGLTGAPGARIAGVRTRRGELRAGQTVIAAGAWSIGLGELLGLPLPTRPIRGQMLALADTDPPLRHAVAGAGGFLIPRADGTVAVAATVDDAGFDTSVTPDGLVWLAGLIRTLAPSYTQARVVETWAGLRPGTTDDRPIMGPVPGRAGLWVATGHAREGIIWAPLVGETLAAALLTGEVDPELAPYSPARFAQG